MGDVVVVNNYAFPCRERSTAKNPVMRCEEDLAFGARGTLEDIRVRYGVETMMMALHQVARHFMVNRNELLEGWVGHYGPTLLVEAGIDVEDVLSWWGTKKATHEPGEEGR